MTSLVKYLGLAVVP